MCSCRGCVLSRWGCNWCVHQHLCTHKPTCEEGVIIYNQYVSCSNRRPSLRCQIPLTAGAPCYIKHSWRLQVFMFFKKSVWCKLITQQSMRSVGWKVENVLIIEGTLWGFDVNNISYVWMLGTWQVAHSKIVIDETNIDHCLNEALQIGFGFLHSSSYV